MSKIISLLKVNAGISFYGSLFIVAGIGTLAKAVDMGLLRDGQNDSIRLWFILSWFLSNTISSALLTFCDIGPFNEPKEFWPLYVVHQIMAALAILGVWLLLFR